MYYIIIYYIICLASLVLVHHIEQLLEVFVEGDVCPGVGPAPAQLRPLLPGRGHLLQPGGARPLREVGVASGLGSLQPRRAVVDNLP